MDDETAENDSIAPWTAYWHGGKRASCFEGSETEVRLAGIWHEFVDTLPRGSRVLDLATGNGTVARNCAARGRMRDLALRIEAVDAAGIDPPKHAPDTALWFRDIRFRGRVFLEDLPYPDAAFTAVVSQFGFEYASEQHATAEIARVLAPGGRLRLVMHARDGAIVRDIGWRVERLRAVLAGSGPVSLVRELVRAESPDPEEIRQPAARLPQAVEVTRKLAENPPADDAALYYAETLLMLWSRRERYWPADLRRSVEQGFTDATDVLQRQEQMLVAARSEDDVAALRERFESAGLAVDATDPIRDEQRDLQIAWLIDARRRSAP